MLTEHTEHTEHQFRDKADFWLMPSPPSTEHLNDALNGHFPCNPYYNNKLRHFLTTERTWLGYSPWRYRNIALLLMGIISIFLFSYSVK